MKKHILTIIAIGLIFGAMLASVQAVYAASEPEGCIAFTSSESFTVSLGDSVNGITWGHGETPGTIEFSKTGTDWQEYNVGTLVEAAPSNDGYSIFFRGKGNTFLSFHYHDEATSTFILSGSEPISCSGNIESLLDHAKVDRGEHPKMDKYAFVDLFSGCTNLTKAPELPAETLTEYCYYRMFKGCTGLTEAPVLPATKLANYCYQFMFEGCTGLTTAPQLPATTLADSCYYRMLAGCTGLAAAPELPATTLVSRCYEEMFKGCTGLATAPALPATMLADYCYCNMFANCTGLTTAPELPVTTLATGCYDLMFEGCTGLTAAPELPATTLADYCYYRMFAGCTGLTAAPELPATTLASSCYGEMFWDCTGLTTAPVLPATTLADRCYRYMFRGCTGLTTAPALPATMLADRCYQYMFLYCSSLTEAPELPATTLADYCYCNMFQGDRSLTTVPALPATTLTDYCYFAMFAESGIRLSEVKGTVDDVYYGIPYQIPKAGNGTVGTDSLRQMFSDTSGVFRGTPDLNKPYYLAVPDWGGSGTEEYPYVISDVKGWNALATMVKAGYSTEGLFFSLGDNIEVTSMIGTYEKPFSGSFDGAGKTLTFNAEDAPEMCAPFVYVKDAEFKNLHIAGTIKTGQQFAAGLIGRFDGTVNVTNCRCSITIESSIDGDGTHGGFISVGERNGAACFEGCAFDGKLLGPKTTRCGGFLGWANPTNKTYTIKDCLFAPKELTLKSDLFNFIRNAPASTTIQNSYYTKNIGGNSQGVATRSVTVDEGITIVKEKTTEYDVSKIVFYKTGLALEDAFYAGKDDKVTITIPSACDEITASAGTLAGEGKDFTLTMPDQDVTLTLNKGAKHIWGKATYTWSDDSSKVKAERTCSRESCGAAEEETVSAAGKVTKEPTCLDKGETTYTSEAFKNKAFEVQKKTLEDVPATGHAWGAWTPLDENQHQRVCENDSEHTEKADHAWNEGVVTREATTEEAGEKLFTCGVCGATRTESIPVLDIDLITPSDVTADTAPVDPGIPVIDADRITTAGNFARKEMKIIFPADAAVTNYRIQYRRAGETDWQAGWSAGTDTYIIHDLAKASLCEFRIAGYVKQGDGSWARSEWSDIAYRYMKAVKLKSAKAGKKSIKLTWAKDKKGSGYQIKYFTDKSIHMADADTITIKGKKKTKYTIKQLQKGQTYYVRIRPTKVRNGIEYHGILKNTKKAKVK